MAEKYVLRPATPDDEPFIRALRRRNYMLNAPILRIAGFTREEVDEAMDDWIQRSVEDMRQSGEPRTTIAETADGKPVGYIIVSWGVRDDFSQHPQGFIWDVGVAREHWGTGVAKLLMDDAETYVREKGGFFIALNVNANNGRAVAFYKKLGYLEEWKTMGKMLLQLD